MARGVDTSQDPRRDLSRAATMGLLGEPKGSTGSRVAREVREQDYMFGVTLGPQDSGERSGSQPYVPPDATIEDRGIKWNQRAAPVGGDFEGAPADDIRLAQMHVNREHAMASLMQPPPTNEGAEKMVDLGMSGRLSTGQHFPVRTYFDERILLKPNTEDRSSQFHTAHNAAHENESHPDNLE